MSNRFRGKRGSQGDGWTWDDDPSGDERTPSRRGRSPLVPVLLLVVLVAILAVVGVIIAVDSRDGGRGLGGLPAGSGLPATPTSSPGPSESLTTPLDDSQPSFGFFAWSRSQKQWESGSLQDTDYGEGEAIPIMIRVDKVTRGTVYELKLRYECATGSANAFDFLTGLPDQETLAATVAPGPRRARADSTLPMPDDPSIPYDDGLERRFRVWGGLFHDPPVGPVPATACGGDKRISLTVRAQENTIFLIVGAHLASPLNWGEGKGASASNTKLTLDGAVGEAPAQTITIAPGTVRH